MISNSKEFEEFLKSKKISVVEGRVKISDADKIAKLDCEFRTIQAQTGGLPKKLKKHADAVVTAEFENMARESQDPDKFGCKLVSSSKNYDDDTWNGDVKGTVKQIWDWAIAESGLDPYEIEDDIECALEAKEEA